MKGSGEIPGPRSDVSAAQLDRAALTMAQQLLAESKAQACDCEVLAAFLAPIAEDLSRFYGPYLDWLDR